MSSYCNFTSESVAVGHPDKVADQISDAVLDFCLQHDPSSRVACETLVTTDLVVVAGEVTTQAPLTDEAVDRIVRETVRDIGYVEQGFGFAADTCRVQSYLHQQSPDIARGVDVGGASDQGMMMGYAAAETEGLMPAPVYLCHRLMEAHERMRRTGELRFLRPDAKAQVTVAYQGDGTPARISGVVFSTQHDRTAVETRGATELFSDNARRLLIERLVEPTLRAHAAHLLRGQLVMVPAGEPAPSGGADVPCYINQTGLFLQGGPHGDCGLTGRKIIVDTYGGVGRHGGGAFSGKDPTKVDRSAAYMCRSVAKHIVKARLAQRCEVRVAYAIGRDQPVDFAIDTFGTARTGMSDEELAARLAGAVDMRPASIIAQLGLRRPMYRRTAAHGHFGREGFPWEEARPELVALLQAIVAGSRHPATDPLFARSGVLHDHHR
jgi:S-adenosylmethionine synthetase